MTLDLKLKRVFYYAYTHVTDRYFRLIRISLIALKVVLRFNRRIIGLLLFNIKTIAVFLFIPF